MIKFIQIENGLALIKWENLDDSVELKKFMDNCEVSVHYQNISNPFNVKEKLEGRNNREITSIDARNMTKKEVRKMFIGAFDYK